MRARAWFFQGKQSLKLRDNNIPNDIEDFGFVIPFVDIGQPNIFYDNKLSTFIRPLAYQIKDYAEALNIIRCRLYLTILHKQKYTHPPHIDIQDPKKTQYVSAILYINDTDGDTIIGTSVFSYYASSSGGGPGGTWTRRLRPAD